MQNADQRLLRGRDHGGHPDSPTVRMVEMSKRFGGSVALDSANLDLAPGSVHGLLGKNGSGKSTLIKILAGYHEPDSGELWINGHQIELPMNSRTPRESGISFVQQNLGLIPSLSVAENLRLSTIALPDVVGRAYLSWRRQEEWAANLLRGYGIDLDPRRQLSLLDPITRAMVAIIRALNDVSEQTTSEAGASSLVGKTLVLDEPTVYLPRDGVDMLFGLVRRVAAQGACVLFVSHNVAEVREITDELTVLRDGKVVRNIATSDISDAEIIEDIVGDVDLVPTPVASRADVSADVVEDVPAAIIVRGLCARQVSGVGFDMRPGEVVGVTGLAGSGFDEIAGLLVGAVDGGSGSLDIGGGRHDLSRFTPRRALKAGVCLVPADRQGAGSVGELSIMDNLMLPILGRYFRRFRLDAARMRKDAVHAMAEFEVNTSNPDLNYDALSGGNQQKVLLARWIQTSPALLVLHEPTQGVDIGARAKIFRIIAEAASRGLCVLCASSDYEQLVAICDRIIVIGGGKVQHELANRDRSLSEAEVAAACFKEAS